MLKRQQTRSSIDCGRTSLTKSNILVKILENGPVFIESAPCTNGYRALNIFKLHLMYKTTTYYPKPLLCEYAAGLKPKMVIWSLACWSKGLVVPWHWGAVAAWDRAEMAATTEGGGPQVEYDVTGGGWWAWGPQDWPTDTQPPKQIREQTPRYQNWTFDNRSDI